MRRAFSKLRGLLPAGKDSNGTTKHMPIGDLLLPLSERSWKAFGSARRRRRIPAPDNDDLDAPAPPRANPPSYPRMTHPWLMSVTAAGMADTDLGIGARVRPAIVISARFQKSST